MVISVLRCCAGVDDDAGDMTAVIFTGISYLREILLFVGHPNLKTDLRLSVVPLCLHSPDKISVFIYPKPQKDPIRGLFQQHEIIKCFLCTH